MKKKKARKEKKKKQGFIHFSAQKYVRQKTGKY